MNCRPWLERVAEELAGQGLPAGVRTRLLDELRDHLNDLMEGGTNVATDVEMESRMGSPEELAAGAAADYRRAAWVRRHPLLVFGVAPVPVVLLGMMVYLLSFAAIGYVVDAVTHDRGGLESIPRNIIVPVATGFTYSIRFVPFLALAVVFGYLATRYRVRGWWLFAAVVQVAILAGAATAQLDRSDLPGQSQLSVGLGTPLTGWLQAIQLLLPLAIGCLFLRAMVRRARAIA